MSQLTTLLGSFVSQVTPERIPKTSLAVASIGRDLAVADLLTDV